VLVGTVVPDEGTGAVADRACTDADVDDAAEVDDAPPKTTS
jgi:hypothetical protein